MFEIEYYYWSKLRGCWMKDYKTFYDINKAVRFAYKCVRTQGMVYGDVTCNDSEEIEEFNRRFH